LVAVIRIPVVEDQLIQTMVEEALSDGGLGSAITTSSEEAVPLVQGEKFAYRPVVTDINLGGLDGSEVAKRAYVVALVH
jgi:CheY-like chemotaxis protein